MTLRTIKLLSLLGLIGLGLTAGCAVPQPRGEGMYRRVVEPRTNAVYHLYLPVDYVKSNGRHPLYPRFRKWPLVMTFHGMKPYDNAIPQEREWEKQADIYGYVVCAPELETSDSFMEYPLTKEHGYVLRDRDHVLAIMDHVFETTLADPDHVLSTSWSCGGYLAHYFPNRFPERFSCIATRLSNFSQKMMIEETVSRYKDRIPVAVFIGDGDLPACKSESEEAVAWYLARNFRTVRGKMIDSMGHRRIPQTAAAFFAEQIGITPLRPVEAMQTVAQVQMTEYYPPPELVAQVSPPMLLNPVLASNTRPSPTGATPYSEPIRPDNRRPPVAYTSTTAGRNYPFERATRPEPRTPTRTTGTDGITAGDSPRTNAQPARSERYSPPPVATRTPTDSNRSTTPPDETSKPRTVADAGRAKRIGIKVKGPAVGTAPYYLSYSVDVQPNVSQGADFLWKDNDQWMGDEPSGVKILETPGIHRITVLMITRDNIEYRGITTVQVLDRGAAASAGPGGNYAAP